MEKYLVQLRELTGDTEKAVYRIIDANLNRLGEALRVLEEYYRLIKVHKDAAIQMKLLRHSLIELVDGFDMHHLLQARNTHTDPLARTNRQEELNRKDINGILRANFKRSQEAARVIEEYAKITQYKALSESAKKIRFSLYDIEKNTWEIEIVGQNQ